MCGRYTLHTSAAEVAEHFELDPGGRAGELVSRYNIAPTQDVPAVGPSEAVGRGLAFLRWGLVPHWSDGPSDLPSLIYARSETVHEKPAFRSAFARRRCLLPADGYFEWKKEAGGKQPYHLRLPGGGVFAFAGIWDRWDGVGDGEDASPIFSCALLTTEAAPEIAGLHDRMPVLLPPEEYGSWLDRSIRERGALDDLLSPPEGTALEYHPVSRRVNSPANDEPACIEPLGN